MKNRKWFRKLCVLLFAGYLGVLVYFLFFAEMLGRDTAGRAYVYNLEPFREIRRFIKYRAKLGAAAVWLNLAGNVAAFIPFGVFVPFLFKPKARLWQIAACTVCFSLLIESVQLVLRVGSFDIDDILLNTAGGLIGGALYCVWAERKKD